jgi:hypothetical protein
MVSARGEMAKGQADQAMYNYQAGVAQMNSQIARKNAEYALKVGGSEAYRSGVKTGQEVGQMKAIQGASGVNVNTGTTKALRDTQTKVGQLDQQTIRENYAKKAYGYEVESETKKAEVGANIQAGKFAEEAGNTRAFASILGTVGSVASKWSSASSAGAV